MEKKFSYSRILSDIGQHILDQSTNLVEKWTHSTVNDKIPVADFANSELVVDNKSSISSELHHVIQLCQFASELSQSDVSDADSVLRIPAVSDLYRSIILDFCWFITAFITSTDPPINASLVFGSRITLRGFNELNVIRIDLKSASPERSKNASPQRMSTVTGLMVRTCGFTNGSRLNTVSFGLDCSIAAAFLDFFTCLLTVRFFLLPFSKYSSTTSSSSSSKAVNSEPRKLSSRDTESDIFLSSITSEPSLEPDCSLTWRSHSWYISYAVVLTAGLSVINNAVLCLEQSSMKHSRDRDPASMSVPSTKMILGPGSRLLRSFNETSLSLLDSNGVWFWFSQFLNPKFGGTWWSNSGNSSNKRPVMVVGRRIDVPFISVSCTSSRNLLILILCERDEPKSDPLINVVALMRCVWLSLPGFKKKSLEWFHVGA
ncbi:hypothetical protein OGAPHI_003702 [Ogataea philodendri]|uniref:Uncharacterized protein n=1 Tax=Ogataea philodendri TaxID=1378263 RepID=A0A9P8P5N0_9ASCO|nr:uncharacterized protein OGAPHI_003702 [Ogataea philodendri]KAH3665516.1 hypothetical protein OGAPHI_003702 [Ogataea philodendri]